MKTRYIHMMALAALGLTLSAEKSFAQAALPQEGPTLNRRVRNLGMGNIGVAVKGTGESSPFYNPAGLNDVEKWEIRFMSITGDISKDATGLIKDLKNLKDDVDAAATEADRTSVLSQFIQKRTGQFDHVRFGIDLVDVAMKNFAAGLVLDEKLDVSFRDVIPPHFDMRNLGDVAIYVAGAHDFWDKLLQVGVTLRPTIRFSLDEADQQIDFTDVAKDANGNVLLKDQFKKLKDRRFGLGVDVGLKSNLAFPIVKNLPGYDYLKPEVGVTWQDVGSPTFADGPENEQSLSAGFAVHPDVWKLKNTVGFDFRDINRDIGTIAKLHFGAESELFWNKIGIALRGGASQGYLTGGVTFNLYVVKIDGAIYSEEVGVHTRQSGNTRYAVNLSFNI